MTGSYRVSSCYYVYYSLKMTSTIKASISFALAIAGLGWIGLGLLCRIGPNPSPLIYREPAFSILRSMNGIYSSHCVNSQNQ